ncbi:response regulator [Phototrophicus methaneseepsis]|uniref:Circadian input-output histidine kinase CikA n=1 Tax=Phototrophicus methaneseepsis TaxID=2710758 RepID=A0A7S8IG35_9CHLR|nr:response regulator [Phototrophicus methaneseepsis]QPC84134.1 response regulator [Phototrophicus methaneseepsis]
MPSVQELQAKIDSLLEENERLILENATLEAIGDGILVINREGKVIKYNDRFWQMWWDSSEDLECCETHDEVLELMRSQIHPNSPRHVIKNLLKPANSPQQLIDIELSDGRVFEQYSGTKYVRNSVVGYVWSFRDVTERRHAERELHRYQQYIERVITSAPIVLFAVDADGTVTFAQGKALARMDLDQDELVGANIFSGSIDHPMLNDLRGAFNGESTRKIHELQGLFFDISARPFYDENDQILGIVGLMVDVTDQMRAREALQYTVTLRAAKEAEERARKAAEDANLAKSTFLANMSHELRTPLNSVIGFSQFLVHDPKLSSSQREYVQLIMRSSEHLLTLINDILEMSRIESGRVQLNPIDFDLREILEGLDSVYHAQASTQNLYFDTDFAEDLPRYLCGDRNKLRQILVNLLSNAIKFTDEGGITLRAWIEPDANQQRNHLFFEVRDTGIGIGLEELNVLFEPFVQTDSGRQAQTGSGLGLAISREFAQMLGGNIIVNSEVGKGSIFTVDVYMDNATVVPTAESNNEAHVIGIASDEPKYRALVVDDKWENRLMLLKMLERVGFEVLEAANGREALQMWQVNHPQIVFMDMRMPEMNGYEATRRIRAQAIETEEQPVIIAVTASAFEQDRERVMAVGCDDYVSKPFKESVLFDRIAHHLDLEFIYEDPEEEGETDTHVPEVPETLELPAEMIGRLKLAIKNLSVSEIERLAPHVREIDAQFAKHLLTFARNFDFRSIAELIDKAEGRHD